MNIFTILFFIILLMSSYTDIQKRIISNKLMIISSIIGIFLNIYYDKKIYIFLALIIFIVLLFSPITSGGDIKLLSISAMYIQDKLSSFFFFLSIVCIVIMMYHKLKKIDIKNIPLAPYILITFILNTLFNS